MLVTEETMERGSEGVKEQLALSFYVNLKLLKKVIF